jgi:hypothetical protein
LIINRLPKLLNDGRWCPCDALFGLLLNEVVQDRCDPILKLAIIVVWNNEVPYPIEAPPPEIGTVLIEATFRGEIGRCEALDQIFLYTPRSRNNP